MSLSQQTEAQSKSPNNLKIKNKSKQLETLAMLTQWDGLVLMSLPRQHLNYRA